MRNQYKVLTEKYTGILSETDTYPPPPSDWKSYIRTLKLPDTDEFINWLFSKDALKYLDQKEGIDSEFYKSTGGSDHYDIDFAISSALDFLWDMERGDIADEWRHKHGISRKEPLPMHILYNTHSKASRTVVERVYSEGFIPWKRIKDTLYKDNPGVNIDI